MDIDLDPSLLRTFLAVAETGSFTAAADLVGRTQSAISQKIGRLEDRLGVRVFERTSRSLTLTIEGERLLPLARQMIELNDQAVALFRSPNVGGTLRLGVADDFLPNHLPILLARFRRQNPGIHITLRTGMSCELVDAITRGELDLAIAERDKAPDAGRVLWREPLVWIGAPGFSARFDPPIPLVVLPPPCRYRAIAEASLRTVGRSTEIACTASSLLGIQAAVRGGLGVTVLGRSFVTDGLMVMAGHADWPTLPDIEIAVFGEDKARDDLARPLVDFLMDTLASPRLQFANLPLEPAP